MRQTQAESYDPELIRRLYSRVIWIYDLWSRLTEEKTLQTVLNWVKIREGRRILETGVGTGRLFSRIVTLNANGMNTGIDISGKMLNVTRKKCGVRSNYKLLHADITDLPDSLGYFDTIICTYVLDLLPEKYFTPILSRFHHMLLPGGRLIIAYMEAGKDTGHRFWGWVAATFPDLMTHCRPIGLESFLKESGFRVNRKKSLTQSTFPSCVLEATVDNREPLL